MVYALITLYGYKDNIDNNIKMIAKQVDRVIVCDNSKKQSKIELPGNVEYLFNNNNLGISAAFNKVLKDNSRNWKSNDYILFFDQDTAIPEHHIKALINEFEHLKSDGINVGIIGPAYYDINEKQVKLTGRTRVSERSWNAEVLLTSSSLSTYENLHTINFWNDNLFLDLCDWDLVWRFKQAGYSCIITDISVIRHALGESVKRIGPIKAKESMPIREYYETRDCMKLMHKAYTPKNYKIRFVAQVTLRPILHLLLLPHKKERIKFIIQGFRDYLRGVDGEYCKESR